MPRQVGEGPTGDVDQRLRAGFLRRIVRLLAEDFGCAAVVAVHPSHVDDDAYRDAAGFLSAPVTVPRLTSATGVPNLRSMLILAHTSLAVACTAATTRIEQDHVDLAARELRP